MGTLGFPGMIFGAEGAELAAASFVCLRTTKGSTNLPEVGVEGGKAALDENSSPDALPLSLSVDFDRSLVLRGVIGRGAAMLCPACVTPLYIDCGLARFKG